MYSSRIFVRALIKPNIVRRGPCLCLSKRRYSTLEEEEDAKEKLELFESVLQASSSKREARTYLQHFKPTQLDNERMLPGHVLREKNITFIKGFLNRAQSVNFERGLESTISLGNSTKQQDLLHIALLKLRLTSDTDDLVIRRIGRTLRKLRNLGLRTVVLLESSGIDGVGENLAQVRDQADRVVDGLEYARIHARRVDGSVTIDAKGNAQFTIPRLILEPLSRGVIPVIPPIAALDASQSMTLTSANTLLLGFTRMITQQQSEGAIVNIDRIFILDPLGGLPSNERQNGGAHVFVNLQQEHDRVLQNLQSEKTSANKIHISNLATVRDCLSILPRTSSALITTPSSAAAPPSSSQVSHRKNPLIHNLLTDKPIFSSSLPLLPSTPTTNTTFIKFGMPLLTIPPSSFSGGFKFSNHPAINMKRLVELVEDSFGKELHVDHYLNRVDKSIACVIIAGDYEGGAIITYEEGNNRKVPYLDKFIVARKSQGIGGVADIVFKGMVDMFPDELLWRSRRNNPVNTWYFERSKGTYKVNDRWTMFWTTPEIDASKFEEYMKICSSIEPSLQE